MRRKSMLVVLVSVIIISLAFLFLDFSAANSETRADSQVSIASSGKPETDLTGELYIFVEKDDGLTEVLKSRLTEELRGQGIKIFEVKSLGEKYDDKALAVATLKREISYNPFFPSADLEVLFFYSSNGNTSYFGAIKRGEVPPFIIEHKELFIEGHLKLTDVTRGIISLRAYQNHLADEIAKNIILKLQSDLK